MKPVDRIRNYYFDIPKQGDISSMHPAEGSLNNTRNIGRRIMPIQFQRIRNDIGTWREAATEAEMALFPHRVKMMRLFYDTINDGHVKACMNRRRNLTLLRDFKICDEKGIESIDLKSIFRDSTKSGASIVNGELCWFDRFIFHTLDASAFGFSLISLGDMIDFSFPNLYLIKREHVSPDRLNVNSLIYSLSGVNFSEDPYLDWHIYIPTPNETSTSPCGYGYLYEVAKYEIFVRNNLGYNADFVEKFNNPFVKGVTSKSDEDERDNFESFLKNAGSQGYIMLDEDEDAIELIESKNVGTAYQSFDNFESRNQKLISKCILGHADAMDSTPGKLGGAQDGNDSPAGIALSDIQSIDGRLVQNVVNYMLIPRMRKIGFDIPLNYHFEFLNDDEKAEIKKKENESNTSVATIAKTMKEAGLQMDAGYFQERTGIPTTMAPVTPQLNKTTL